MGSLALIGYSGYGPISRFNKVNLIFFIVLRNIIPVYYDQSNRLRPLFFFKHVILSTIDTMALEEIIEQSSGKITGERVLDVEIPKMETLFAME